MVRKGRSRGRRGQGSITGHEGAYLARWSRTEGGVRTRVAKTFVLRGDAEWWLSQARRHGMPPDDPTVAEHMTSWLAGKRSIRASTRTQYREHVELHIVPVLGAYRLSELRRRHVEAFVEDRLRVKVGKKVQRPISPATVGKILTTLRSGLESAVPRTIPDNPAAKVEAPKVEREPVAAMTPDEAKAIVATVRGTWLEHITRFLLGSGLRVGEAIGLDQGDVHDGWVSVRVSKTVVRAVRVSADADAAIHEAVRTAPRRGKGEPVFFGQRRSAGTHHEALPPACGPRGGVVKRRSRPSDLRPVDRMRQDSVTAGLTRMTGLSPHKLRHGVATLMVARGVPMRRVAEQLGHANPSLTARVYAHVAPDSLAEDVRVLDEAVR